MRILTCMSSIIFWTNASVCLCMAFSDSCFALSPSLILSCSSSHFCKKNVDTFSEAVNAYSLSVFIILFHLPFFVWGVGILQNPEGFPENPPPSRLRPCLLIRIRIQKHPMCNYIHVHEVFHEGILVNVPKGPLERSIKVYCDNAKFCYPIHLVCTSYHIKVYIYEVTST